MKTKTIKKIISWTITVPCLLITFSEFQNINDCWIQFVALGAVILVAYWNGLFKGEDYETISQKRRRY